MLQTLVYAGPFLLLSFAGALAGITHLRWGPRGVYLLVLGAIVAAGTGIFLLTWQRGWLAVGHWFVRSSPLGLSLGWPVLAAAVLATATFAITRRTPA